MADNSPSSGGTGDTIASDDIAGIKFQRLKLVYGDDGVNAGDVSATNPYPTSVNGSIFRFSTNNSTTVQLAAGATFNGVIETALDQPSISILLSSDQAVRITIYQYIDVSGVFAAQPIIFDIPASQGFSSSLPLNANYIKASVQNRGTAASCTVVELLVEKRNIEPLTVVGNPAVAFTTVISPGPVP